MSSTTKWSAGFIARATLILIIAALVIGAAMAYASAGVARASDPGIILEGDIVAADGTSLDVREGKWRSYTVRLATQPDGDVTVHTDPFDDSTRGVHVQWGTAYPRVRATTFTQSNWNVPQTVYIWGWGDHDDDDDTERVRHHASGGGYDGVVKNATAYIGEKDSSSFPGATPTPTPTPAATPIPTPTPGASPGLVLTDTATGDPATDVRVPQGGSGSFDIRLNTTPSANVPVSVYELYDGLGTISYSPQTVTFTPDNWNASQTVTVYSSNSPDRRQNKGTLLIRTGHTDDTTGYYNMPWTYFNVYEYAPPAIRVHSKTVAINEGESRGYAIWMNTKPTANVTVTATEGEGDADLAITAPANKKLTFTPGNYNYAQYLNVAAAQDDDLTNGSRTFTLAAASDDAGYDGLTQSVTATENDDDTPSIVVSSAAATVPEGGTATYNVRLSNKPSGGVTVAISASGDTDITVSPASLAFTTTNWNQPQTVTLSAAQDGDDLIGASEITHTASGANFGDAPTVAVSATEGEDDRRGFIVSPAPGIPVNINEGETHTYTIKLGTQPTADVTVNIARATGGDTDITVSPASLTFTTANYSNAQTVTISAAKDDSELETATATITHSVATADSIYAEQVLHDINVTAANTTIAQFILTNNNGNFISALTAPEGSSPAYKVELLHRPLGNVTVTIAEGTANDDDTDITVTSSKTLTFNTGDWKIAKTVTLNAARDADALAGSRSITHTATGGGYDNASMTLLVTEQDEDAAIIILGNAITTLYVQESGSATYNVKLGATPSSNVTVALSATGGDDDITFAPSSLTFTPANHSTAQTVTVSAAVDADDDRGTKTIIHTATSADANYHGKKRKPHRNREGTSRFGRAARHSPRGRIIWLRGLAGRGAIVGCDGVDRRSYRRNQRRGHHGVSDVIYVHAGFLLATCNDFGGAGRGHD